MSIQTPAGSGTDPYIKTDDLGGTTGNVQHLRVDIGTGSTASQVIDTNPFPTYLKAKTTGGLTTYKTASLINSGVSIKASAGQVFGWYIMNTTASILYVKLINLATTPTVGVDLPMITLGLPSASAANAFVPHGIAFSDGIAIYATSGNTDANTGSVSANSLIVNIFYA